MPQLLSPCSRACEPQLLKPRGSKARALELKLEFHSSCGVDNRRSHCNQKSVHCSEEQLLLAATGEKPAHQQRPSTAKNYIKKKNKTRKWGGRNCPPKINSRKCPKAEENGFPGRKARYSPVRMVKNKDKPNNILGVSEYGNVKAFRKTPYSNKESRIRMALNFLRATLLTTEKFL